MSPQGVRTRRRRRSQSVLIFEHKLMRAASLDSGVWCLECDEIIKVGAAGCSSCMKMTAPYDKY